MTRNDHHAQIDEILAQARARLERLEPEMLEREQANGALVIDIRPVEQRIRDGELPGAVVIDRNILEWRLDPACEHHIPQVTDHQTRIVIVCNEGYSSSLAAAQLHDLGLHRATDLVGGFKAWSEHRSKWDDRTGRHDQQQVSPPEHAVRWPMPIGSGEAGRAGPTPHIFAEAGSSPTEWLPALRVT